MHEVRERLEVLGRSVSPRAAVRGAFLAFFLVLCVRLWLFYRWAEGLGPYVPRPEAVTGLIPLGAYMSFFAWLKSGVFDPVLPAGVVIVIGALATSVLFKRGFCGWICPLGSLWHGFAWAGRKLLGRTVRPPRWLDLGMRGLRYAVTAYLVAMLAQLPVELALNFQKLPYYAAADLKILSLFVRPTPLFLAVGALVAALSMLFGNVWCRYLCPLGGVYGACGVASPCNVVRNPVACTSCGKCAVACHAAVPVDRLRVVRAPECDGCLDCVLACPTKGALQVKVGGRRGRAIPWWAWPTAVVGLWLVVYAAALGTGHWRAGLPEAVIAQYARMIVTTPTRGF